MFADLETQVLMAVVEGYRAREGLKDRIRALNEWEIARRAVQTELSYVEYLEHPLREDVLNALLALQRRGFVAVWERGAKYDTFVPTPTGEGTLSRGITPGLEDNPATPAAAPVMDPVIARLDEIVSLLRSIDEKLSASSDVEFARRLSRARFEP